MADDPLDLLLRLRARTVDEARQALADCLVAEAAARERISTLEASVVQEVAAASAVTADDLAVEALSVWLRQTRSAQHAAQAALEAAEAQCQEARMVLSAARAGVRAVETVLEHKADERRVQAERAEQRRLDEAAVRPSA